ncbi:MAG TPA: hypothetical protein VGI46_06825 [Candidatus Acidoferrum sp.]|jgi:hypothetical protein
MKPERRHYHKVTPAQVEAIRMYASIGLPYTEAASRIGLPIATFSRISARLGLSQAPPEPLPQEMQERILQMYLAGAGRPSIAAALELPPHRVEQILIVAKLRPQSGEPHCAYHVPPAIQTAMRRDFRQFEKQTAQKYGVSLAWLRRFLRRRQQ